MLTFCKSGLQVLMLGSVLLSSLAVSNDAQEASWESRIQRLSLLDGSTLSEYIAETESVQTPGVLLRTTYIPRFSCKPLTSIIFDANPSPQNESFAAQQQAQLDFFIDGTPVSFPALIDRAGNQLSFHFHGSQERRVKLRLMIDVGDRAQLQMAEETIDFSLLGSRKMHAYARKHCREHRPDTNG